MRLYPSGKVALKFKNGSSAFLNAYTTNTPEAPKNAFVDIRGRIVAVVDQFFLSSEEIVHVLERHAKDRLLIHLEKYLALSETVIETLPDFIYYDLDTEAPFLHRSLQELAATVTPDEFATFKKDKNLRIQGIDYDKEMLLDVFPEGLVSYTKGCYLGQEIIARVHFRSKRPGAGS